MIECVFTIDYEIYGNGEGSLRELIYEPAQRLMEVFHSRNVRFVPFVEVAEIEKIDERGVDKQTINLIKNQVCNFHKEGFEIGLHLHPQWFNAKYENGEWLLDYNEYNLCTLPRERITQIIKHSIAYLRNILDESDYAPLSFRAGNWLFRPTEPVASILAENGIKIDSSVYKGGLQQQHKLDYRRSLKNGFYWSFSHDVNIPDSKGSFIEIPIYTEMVPSWKMLTTKRIGLQRKASSTSQKSRKKMSRLMDFIRFRNPLKFDFCRMTLNELTLMVETVIKKDQEDPTSFRPMVAIGHTKDLVDYETVESFLSYLERKGIAISTFEKVYEKCR